MFTIADKPTEYPSLMLAIAAGRALSFEIRKSVRILKNGKFVRLLRY